jgi:hypothetical protein
MIDLRVDAGSIAAITQVVYAPAWQQQSGPEGCFFGNFVNWGIFLELGYGGAAQLTMRRNQFNASAQCIPGSACIKFGNIGGSVGRLKVTLEENNLFSALASFNFANPIAPALTFTGAPNSGATSATLTGNWTGTTGAYLVWFVETAGGANELRSVTLTNGQTTANWAAGGGALAANCNATTSAAPTTAISGALSAAWAFPSGTWNITFSDGEQRNVALVNGQTTATWTGNITSVTGVAAAATGVSPNSQGVATSNNTRVNLDIQNVHFEQLHDAFNLDGATALTGQSVAADANPTVTNLFTLQTTWTGYIAAEGIFKGGALTYINDLARLSLTATEPSSGILIWPPGPIPGMPAWSYDFASGSLSVTFLSAAGGLTINGFNGANLYTTLSSGSGGSSALLWEIFGTSYGRWGVDVAGNLVAGSAQGDSFIRTANKRFLVSTNDGAGIQLQVTSAGDIVQTRGVAVCLRATAIEQRSSTTTLTNSTQLTYAIPAAGTYEFELEVFSYFTTAVTDGITANVNYSGTFTTVGSYLEGYFMNGTTTTTGVQPVEVSATVNNALAGLTLATYGAGVAPATPAIHRIKGNLIATGAGTLAFAFAQSTSGVDTANLGVGSYMKVTQLS